MDTNRWSLWAVGWAGVPVRAHGEDGLGRDRGADRVLEPAWFAGLRAHRLGARPGAAGGAQAAARQRLAAGQGELDLGVDAAAPGGRRTDGGPLPITATRMAHLWDVLGRAFDALGFDAASDGDELFRQLVLARIIEPTSKLDSARVLDEVGVAAWSYPTLKRRLPVYAWASWRQRLAAACAAHTGLGPASLVLFDVATLYFETDAGDGFR